MPAEIDDVEAKPYEYENEGCDVVFDSKDEMKSSMARLCYGDFYVIGKVWIGVLKTILVGAKLCLIPKVQAATVHAASMLPPCPEKPPKMKYTDLPFYECPHKTYKDHLEENDGCRQSKKKILHMMLLPYVKKCRQTVQRYVCTARCEAINTYHEIHCDWKNAMKRVKLYMRDPENLNVRKGVVAMGAGLGCYAGSGGGIPRKIFCAGFGAATAGMLCFPKETDELIREFSYHTGKVILSSINTMCNTNYEMKEKQVCAKDLPPVKPDLKIVQCPQKK